MEILSLILLSISLSMDSLGIGISYGIRKIRIPLSAKLIICAISMIFTAVAVTLGTLILEIVPANIAEIIGVFMLASLGIFIILSSILPKKKRNKKENPKHVWSLALKPLGVTVKIIKNPVYCDFDKSNHIDTFEAIYLGVALSIDSFAAGISSVVSGGINSIMIPIAVGFAQLIFLSFGDLVGKKISSISKVDSKVFVIISGLLLIVMAFIRALV